MFQLIHPALYVHLVNVITTEENWGIIKNKFKGFKQDSNIVCCSDLVESSSYTHSISWALHGKDTAKNQKDNKELLGNKVDKIIRDMCNCQTNGIPQGSTIIDFIAEIILGYGNRSSRKF